VFTGIVEELGEVKKAAGGSQGGELVIEAQLVLSDLKRGDSIAVNGVCLTASDLGDGWFRADIMPETFRKTNLHLLRSGEKVNLERSIQAGGRFGGHIVSGHSDGTARINRIYPEGNSVVMFFSTQTQLLRYIVPKGSVAIDGISLTVADVSSNGFSVSLIPHTRRLTSLGNKRVGDLVNLETDILAKYVESLLYKGREKEADNQSGVTLEFLRQNGFL